MKIIHCADLHIDSKIEGLPAEKSKLRRDEILHTFERMCDYARDEGVSAVIIAGDAFDSPRVSKKTALRFIESVKSAPDTDFLYLSGNHDGEFLSVWGDEMPSNFKVFGNTWTEYRYGGVSVRGITFDKYNAPFVYDALKTAADDINIVCMHGQILGYKSEEAAETVSLPMLKNKNIDYLALGHIHSYAEGTIDERGVYAYSGCLDGRGFDETGVKGFVLLETDGKKLSRRFVPFCSRILATAEFSVENARSFYALRNEILEKLRSAYDEKSLLKVVLTGGHDADFIVDKDDLAFRLNEEFFFAKVYDCTTLKVSAEDFAADKSVRGEFVRAVLSSDVSEEEKERIILTGLAALKGEL